MFSIVLSVEMSHIDIDQYPTDLQHQHANSFPTEPVSMVYLVGIAIEAEGMLEDFLDWMFGEDTEAATDESTSEIVGPSVVGQEFLSQGFKIPFTPHLLQ